MEKTPTATPATEKSTKLKEATRNATIMANSAKQGCDAPDRCAVFVVKRAIQPKSAPRS